MKKFEIKNSKIILIYENLYASTDLIVLKDQLLRNNNTILNEKHPLDTNCVIYYFADFSSLNLETIKTIFILYKDNDIVLDIPLGVISSFASNDIITNNKLGIEDVSLPSLADIYSIVYENNRIPVSYVKKSVIKQYFDSSTYSETNHLFNFLNILKCKKPFEFENIEGDLPYQYLIHTSQSSITKIQSKPLFEHIRVGDKISIFSIGDLEFGHEDKFSLITPFFVKKNSKYKHLTNANSFYEIENDRCSEISAIYNILKSHDISEIIGFCHYRRFLNFSNDQFDQNHKFSEVDMIINKIDNADLIYERLNGYDIGIGYPLDIINSQELQYIISHYPEDYYLMINSMLNKYPFLLESLIESMKSAQLYGSNLIVGKSNIVLYIFNIVFDVLAIFGTYKLEKRTQYQSRDVAFLSERVFDTVVRYLIKENYKVAFLPRINLEI